MGNIPLYQLIVLASAALSIVVAISDFSDRPARRRRGIPAGILFLPAVFLAVFAVVSEVAGWALLVWRLADFSWEPLSTETVLAWVDFYPREIFPNDWSWAGQLATQLAASDACVFFTVILPFSALVPMVAYMVVVGLIANLAREEGPRRLLVSDSPALVRVRTSNRLRRG
ncbi:hypothetical protein ACFSM5_10060 [Lacibacterium aquatile]|uniref:Uncharacterized protein n=1 Tax=Lacibacterium aquatile TaxID=1168082 RepID=A0ABW5DRX7_9PROT